VNIAALIGIMIGIVVGVNLISPVNDVVKTITTPTYSSSMVSLTGVLPIIFVTVIILGAIAWMKQKLVPLCSNAYRITSQIRGSLSALAYGNPELNPCIKHGKCVETRGFAPQVGDGIVRAFRKVGIDTGLQGLGLVTAQR